MPKSLALIISLSFIPIIFAEGHIMNSPFVAIVPLYTPVVRRTVIWSRYRFADFTRLKRVLSYICCCMCCHTKRHGPSGGHLPALCNSGRFLTIPLKQSLKLTVLKSPENWLDHYNSVHLSPKNMIKYLHFVCPLQVAIKSPVCNYP